MASISLEEKKGYSTIQELIDAKLGNEDLNHYNTSILYKIKDIEYPIDNIVYDYLDILNFYADTYTLTDSELDRFQYRPDMLSYELYGTIDFQFIILSMNQMLTPKEFKKRKLKIIEPADLLDILNRIYNAENNYLLKNRQTYEEGSKQILRD